MGLALERVFRKGLGVAAGSAAGFATLIVAHHLEGQGDTLEMMRAVLDSNFWLATHGVTITIGYSATFLASLLAHIYILRSFWSSSFDCEEARALSGMAYGVICLSLFFSFVGTVLGGIWADQSWGRFWGWDPKENGALLIVLWNALILHARWGGYARERGVMHMAIFGGILTSLSWFGVNMLGIGLHSYGFMDKAFYALSAFVLAELAVMGLGSASPSLGPRAVSAQSTPR
jgi:ABC-type transport system involved in cytochrome c biogenesis permease subunit